MQNMYFTSPQSYKHKVYPPNQQQAQSGHYNCLQIKIHKTPSKLSIVELQMLMNKNKTEDEKFAKSYSA